MNHETTRPKRKLILSREMVQGLDSAPFHQQPNSTDQQSKNTNGDAQCNSGPPVPEQRR